MVELSKHLWPAGVAAFTLHSFIIATLAFGVRYQGTRQNAAGQDFCVEVAFIVEAKPEVTFAPKQNQKTLESSLIKPDQSVETPCKPPKKVIPQKTSVKSASVPHNTQKNHQQGSMAKGDATPVHNPAPIYPREARRKKIEGVVLARLSLTASGAVEKVEILLPRPDLVLEAAALQVLPYWRFAPGARIVDVPIEFRLKE